MIYRSASAQSEHDQLVQKVVKNLISNGAKNIKADLPGRDQPTKLVWKQTDTGHIPDVSADGLIVEVETAETITNDHTKDQWTLFSAYASQHNVAFAVVVPAGSEAAAKKRLSELGLQADVYGF